MIKKLLNTDMTWKRVIILSLVSAVVTALLNCIPALEDTSFTAPAVSYEVWVALALYIIVNCKGYKDASLKTFVFFLISQPLIYLIEVPFNPLGFGLFHYYPFWGILTVLTIPGAAIAYRVKKDDALSAVILTVANALVLFIGFSYMSSLIYEFPRYLIAVLFCLALPFVLIFALLKQKKSRTLALVLAIVISATAFYTMTLHPKDTQSGYPLDEEGWTVEYVSGKGIDASIDGDSLTVKSHVNGSYELRLLDSEGKAHSYDVTVSGGSHIIDIRKK